MPVGERRLLQPAERWPQEQRLCAKVAEGVLLDLRGCVPAGLRRSGPAPAGVEQPAQEAGELVGQLPLALVKLVEQDLDVVLVSSGIGCQIGGSGGGRGEAAAAPAVSGSAAPEGSRR
jgi:hypothetical protein